MTTETLEAVAESMGITGISIHKIERRWLCVVTGGIAMGNGDAKTLLEALNAAIRSHADHQAKLFVEEQERKRRERDRHA